MKYILIVLFNAMVLASFCQNVGQEGDSLLNYEDINGFKQGHWLLKYASGKPKYEGYFVDNYPVGEFKRWDNVGRLYADLYYIEGSKKMKAKFYHVSGKVASVGNYIDTAKDSIWLFYNKNGVLVNQESYKVGVKDGAFRQYTFEGVLTEEINWKDGIREGDWKRYYANSIIMFEAVYVNGKHEGLTKTYYPSGKLYMEGKYVNDLKEGAWFKYAENGSLIKLYQYEKGSSPEAMEEEDEMFQELDENKGTIDGPRDANDIDWLRGARY